MKETPFTQIHIDAGAKMAEFAGYNMPISYTSINEEHGAVRNRAGVFDVSHMGEFLIRGEGAVDFLQTITSNDVRRLTNGKAQYTCILNEEGGILDDIIVYCLRQNQEYMAVVNASNIQKDWDWMKQHKTANVVLENISDKTGLLAVQGPEATKILQELTDTDILNLPFYTFTKTTLAGVDDVIISATGYTGAGGVEIYFTNEANHAQKIWTALFAAGKERGLVPVGLAARDTLRLEMGFCLYGNDIDETTSPLEAGLGWITKLNKGDFIGREATAALKEKGIQKKLCGLEMLGKGIPRTGYAILDGDGNAIGRVTSGTQAPTLKKPIALGYVDNRFSNLGTEVFIEVRQKPVPAKIVKVPFQ